MKRGMWWPIAVAGILATTVAANIWVAVIANDDPSFAIEPNYYNKAVAWDTTLAEGRHNTQLGWRLTPTIGAVSRDGSLLISARLTDSTGADITGAVVRVVALQVARASDIHEATLESASGGTYTTRVSNGGRGRWELRFDVRARGTHFTDVARVEAW